MRRQDKEITDKKVIEVILNNADICRIALLDYDRPYIVPLNYGYADKCIYFHSAPSGKKIELIKNYNKVCFEIEYGAEIISTETPCKWTSKYRSLIGYGTVEIITDSGLKKKGLDIIMAHYGKITDNNYDEKSVEKLVILKLAINEISCKQSGKWE